MKLSVVMPVSNEDRWVREVRRVRQVPLAKELIVVDDGSTGGTRAILRELAADYPDVRLLLRLHNRGAAVGCAKPVGPVFKPERERLTGGGSAPQSRNQARTSPGSQKATSIPPAAVRPRNV